MAAPNIASLFNVIEETKKEENLQIGKTNTINVESQPDKKLESDEQKAEKNANLVAELQKIRGTESNIFNEEQGSKILKSTIKDEKDIEQITPQSQHKKISPKNSTALVQLETIKAFTKTIQDGIDTNEIKNVENLNKNAEITENPLTNVQVIKSNESEKEKTLQKDEQQTKKDTFFADIKAQTIKIEDEMQISENSREEN